MDNRQEVYGQWDKLKKDQLVSEHLPMVYSIARRLANSVALGTAEIGDLVNAGVLGLYRALEKYDASKGVSFGTYASHYVRGNMLDEVNKYRQVPRGIRDKHRKVTAAYDELSQRFLQVPDDNDVASYLHITVNQLHEWLVDIGWTAIFSIDELESVGAVQTADDSDEIDPVRRFDEKESKALLVHAIRRLTQKEQQVLYAYYEEELTLKEIAYVMDLSESQISRIHSKAIIRLRGILGRRRTDLALK